MAGIRQLAVWLLFVIFLVNANQTLAQNRRVQDLPRLSKQTSPLRPDKPELHQLLIKLNIPFRPVGNLSDYERRAQELAIARAQDAVLTRLRRSARVNDVKQFTTIPGLALAVDKRGLEFLRLDPLVKKIQDDTPEPPNLVQTLGHINTYNAWSDWDATGNGQTVAILDTGIAKKHPFFKDDKIVEEICYSSTVEEAKSSTVCPNGETKQFGSGAAKPCPLDVSGCDHGTHVAGIAAGHGPLFGGVAYQAKIISVQVFSRFDNEEKCGDRPSPCALTYPSDQILALERVLWLSKFHNIAAVNMSLGGGTHTTHCDDDLRKTALDNLLSVGTATIVSAGNGGNLYAVGAPACISSAVTVGATTLEDAVADFSNNSFMVDLLAPGDSVISAHPTKMLVPKSGTSMAAPHVTGAFALMRSRYPKMSPGEILWMLKFTGVSVLDIRSFDPEAGILPPLPLIQKPRLNFDFATYDFLVSLKKQLYQISLKDKPLAPKLIELKLEHSLK